MLVLSRKVGEKILIAEGLITIVVVRVQGNIVGIGIEAPKEILVDREEVHLKRLVDAAEGAA